ncbi:MAG: helix-turn-helix domain-containing protein [Chloroflexota bacterium]
MTKQIQEPETWYTLSEAAKRLNVHPTTLRRWANNGDIPVMVTPGGHRRFAASDIARFAREHRMSPYTNGIVGLFATQALAHARQEVVVNSDENWLTKFSSEARSRNRLLGQQLMGLTLQYLSSDDDSDAILDQARQVGREYARNAISQGLPMKATLEASMFFHDSLIDTALHLPDTANIRPEANVRLLRRVNVLLNAVHLAVAEEYDSQR